MLYTTRPTTKTAPTLLETCGFGRGSLDGSIAFCLRKEEGKGLLCCRLTPLYLPTRFLQTDFIYIVR